MWEWNTDSTNSFDNLSLPLYPGDPGSPGGPGKPGTPGVPMTPISPLEPRKQIGWEKLLVSTFMTLRLKIKEMV